MIRNEASAVEANPATVMSDRELLISQTTTTAAGKDVMSQKKVSEGSWFEPGTHESE